MLESVVSLSVSTLSLQLLQVVLRLDQFMDLIDEVRLRFGHDSFDLMNLLVDDFVDVLHVIEHLVGLLIELVELGLVVLELHLATVHLLT